jgi:radical SAM superfamily enzyme YgiQ (UPF0313 family)
MISSYSGKIYLVYVSLEPNFFKRLVHKMEETPAFERISWFCYLRVSGLYDEETVRLAKKNGCRLVMFGIETFNQRLLNHIRKGINAETSRKTLKLFHEAGIKTYAWMMVGLPSETAEDVTQDARDMAEMLPWVDAFSVGHFILSPNTDMARNPEPFNIVKYDPGDGKQYTSHFNHTLIENDAVKHAYIESYLPIKKRHVFYPNRYILYFGNS